MGTVPKPWRWIMFTVYFGDASSKKSEFFEDVGGPCWRCSDFWHGLRASCQPLRWCSHPRIWWDMRPICPICCCRSWCQSLPGSSKLSVGPQPSFNCIFWINEILSKPSIVAHGKVSGTKSPEFDFRRDFNCLTRLFRPNPQDFFLLV